MLLATLASPIVAETEVLTGASPVARLHPLAPPPQHRPPPWEGAEARITLWHGTSSDNLPSILAGVDPTKGERASDFGRGFYTTTSQGQAEFWAENRVLKHRLANTASILEAGIIWFRVPLTRLAPLHSIAFVRPEPDNELFWSLVCDCREFPPGPTPDPKKYTHRYPHPDGGTMYDMVVGPVAADWSTKKKPVFRRRVYARYDQFSFHTPAAAAIFNDLIRTGKRGTDFDSTTFAVT